MSWDCRDLSRRSIHINRMAAALAEEGAAMGFEVT